MEMMLVRPGTTTSRAPPGAHIAPNGVFGIYIAHINLICSSELLILILLPINTFTYRQAATTTATRCAGRNRRRL